MHRPTLLAQRCLTLVILATALVAGRAPSARAADQPLDAPRPIRARDTVFLEEMTWMEVRDALEGGTRTVLVPTGGVEQNGPFLALGKHNYVLEVTAERIARALGDALVAPVLKLVPEGRIDPPDGHMRYPGTLSLRPATFRSVLTDLCMSLAAHGFRTIVLIGDSGGNAPGMAAVADKLSRLWARDETRVLFVPEYYAPAATRAWLAEHGIHEHEDDLHDDFAYTAQLLVADPTYARIEERRERGLLTVNGVSIDPVEKTRAIGEALIAHRVERTVQAIHARQRGAGASALPDDGEGAAAVTPLQRLGSGLARPFLAVSLPEERIYWPYLAVALLMAMVAYLVVEAPRSGARIGTMLGWIFPRAAYTHPSARTDYRFFVANKILYPLAIAPWLLGAATVSWATTQVLSRLGDPNLDVQAGMGPTVAYTLVLLLAYDFAVFFAHYLSHKVPVLWEFHKVHHSAEVLTPITLFRMHPVDDVLTKVATSVCMGVADGVFGWLAPGSFLLLAVAGLNIGVAAFYLFGYNLRHSSVWLSYGRWLSRVLVSPAQHQIHHSREDRHIDKNLGLIFAFWDGLFGTLYVPRGREEFALGLAEGRDPGLETVRGLYLTPFRSAFRLLTRGMPAAATEPSDSDLRPAAAR